MPLMPQIFFFCVHFHRSHNLFLAMNKRKSKTKPEAKPSKSLKVDRRSTQEDDFEDDDGLEDHSFSTSVLLLRPWWPVCKFQGTGLSNSTINFIYFWLQSLGDIGVIESITLKNFMCHQNLGPFQFGPNVNFIVGNNGSKCWQRFCLTSKCLTFVLTREQMSNSNQLVL